VIALIIPCFRESRRLPEFLPGLCRELEASALPVEIWPVDDGSGEPETSALIAALEPIRAQFARVRPVLVLPQNQGKGGAVYAGWDAALSGAEAPRWVAFIDADGAVPAAEAVRLLEFALTQAHGAALLAQRLPGVAGRAVTRTRLRRFTGQAFRALVRGLFDLPVADTQCGLKIVPAAAYQAIRPWLAERRFAFDVELTVRLAEFGTQLIGAPISWSESPGTTLRARSAWEMLISLLRVRWRLHSMPTLRS
jgi:dolichyl-phosphate beta-glucosyltransferase